MPLALALTGRGLAMTDLAFPTPSNRECLAWNELRRPQSILRNLRGILQGASEPLWHREREGETVPRI